jgi:hypothetical protein
MLIGKVKGLWPSRAEQPTIEPGAHGEQNMQLPTSSKQPAVHCFSLNLSDQGLAEAGPACSIQLKTLQTQPQPEVSQHE